MKYYFFCIVLLFLSSFLYAQQLDSLSLKEDREALGKKKYKVFFCPVVLYAPEESGIFGGGGFLLFHPSHNDSLTRISNVQGSLYYTLKHQTITQPNYTIFTKRERFLFKGTFGFSLYPIYYYGVGNNTQTQNQQLISYDIITNDHTAFYKLRRFMYAGLGFRYYRMWNVTGGSGGILEETKPPGYNGYIASGLTVATTYDSRNNVITTSKGLNISISQTFHGYAFGGNYNFMRTLIDARKFITLFPKTRKNVLAFQFYSQLTPGNVPFNELGLMGGNMIMRGYYTGRFRDKDLAAAQAEYRRQLTKRFGFVVFAGVGEVAPRVGDFNFYNTKASYGGGLRFRVSKKHNVNLRGDYGIDNRGQGLLYFAIGEAF